MGKSVKYGVLVTLSLRIFLGLVVAITWSIVRLPINSVLNTHLQYELFRNVPIYSQYPLDALITAWYRWDATHYLKLAYYGYQGQPSGALLYYPLYPYLTRVISQVIGGNYPLAGLLLSTFGAFFLFAGLYHLVAQQLNPLIAKWSVIALGVYPTAFFLIAPFTESLFLALTIAMFLFCYKKNWGIAGCFSLLASLTRGPGILNIFPFTLLIFQEFKKKNLQKPIIQMIVGWLLSIIGGISFLVWRDIMGYPSIPSLLASYSISITNPATGLLHAIAQWINIFDLQTSLDVISALIFLMLFCFAAMKWCEFPLEWLVYWGINLALYLSKIHYAASSLQSMARYTLTLFPAFILIGEWLSRQNATTRFIYISLSASLLIILTVLYTAWIFVG